ncbi:MAG TPA: hypothetical protein VGO47_04285 [Chlamydiales bacterium]|nr:hypothetical protein [Chlamydiales bacterium]
MPIPPLQVLSFVRDVLNRDPWYDMAHSDHPMTPRSIIFHMHQLPYSTSVNSNYIEYVGLKGEPSGAEYDRCLGYLLDGVLDEVAFFPALKVIRFVDPKLSEGLTKRPLKLKKWQRECDSRAIRLEGPGGREFES